MDWMQVHHSQNIPISRPFGQRSFGTQGEVTRRLWVAIPPTFLSS